MNGISVWREFGGRSSASATAVSVPMNGIRVWREVGFAGNVPCRYVSVPVIGISVWRVWRAVLLGDNDELRCCFSPDDRD